MPGPGGKRPGAGRPKGVPNKATRDIKALAQDYGPEAIEKLGKLMRGQDERIDRLIGKLIDSPLEDKKSRETITELLARLEERNIQNELGATKEMLDRGYGKAPQNHETEVKGKLVIEFIE